MATRALPLTIAALTTTATTAFGVSGYEHSYQHRVGAASTFHTLGPATGDSPDLQGDAFLQRVEFPSTEEHILFYRPVRVYDVDLVGGQMNNWLVRGGTNTTTGLAGNFRINEMDGNASDLSEDDKSLFADLILQAFNTNNINTYLDSGTQIGVFTLKIEFEVPVRDNDPDGDEFGELLFLERGAGAGNSFLKIQAVDECGVALGPWLVIDPDETVQTTPVTSVSHASQTIGTTAIDVSRLGVEEVRYLSISNDMTGESAYQPFPGSDLNPDFKFMAVITHPDDLAMGGVYD